MRSLKFQLGLAPRVAILAALFFSEKVFLGEFVDFHRAQAAQGLGEFVRTAQHWGFRFAVAFAAATVVFAIVRATPQLRSVDLYVRTSRMSMRYVLVHILSIAILVPLTYLLYRDGVTPLALTAVVTLWIVFGVAAMLAAGLAMIAWPLWRDAARAIGSTWRYAALIALLGTGAWQWSERLWVPATALTFDLVRRVLLPIIPTLSADPSTHVLSTHRFAVQIAEVCSGLEGVGLILAFSAAWLLYFRQEYIFPRALLLIPAGVAAIFGLNVLRIAALILIGNAGFPDVAVYGFHSQAGWIAFIAVACGLVLLSRRSSWLNRTAVAIPSLAHHNNPTAVYLMPLLAILAAGTLSRAMSGSFEFFYPLRLIAGLLMLAPLPEQARGHRLALELARTRRGRRSLLGVDDGRAFSAAAERHAGEARCRARRAACILDSQPDRGLGSHRPHRRGTRLSRLSDAAIGQCGL